MLHRTLLVAAFAPLALATAAVASAPDVPTLPPEALRPGQKAVVRTVFRGDSVETFDAEIVGVLQGGRAEGDMILARATSERVIQTGVAQGMSGSPVYVDGKLVGALSSGWNFARDPLFGITPIREMLEVLDRPSREDAAGASAGPSGADLEIPTREARFREFHWGDEAPSPLEGLEPRGADATALSESASRGAPVPLALPLSVAGLSPAALEPLRRALAPLRLAVVPGGRAASGGPTAASLEPGSAVAVDVLRGDVQMSAIGTVTYRDGDRVLIFGHPFFQSGDVRMPLSTAEITTVVSNQVSSFKLGVRGREAGIVTQDRRAAVAGRIGGRARMLPLAVTVRAPGHTPQRFRFEALEDRALAPSLVGAAAVNSLLESGGSGANQTVRWSLTARRAGAAPLVVEDVTAGDSPPGELMAGIAAPLRFLFNNPYERLTLDSVSVAVDVVPGRDQWTVRNARLLDAAVRPGGRVRAAIEIERWRGGRETRTIELEAPEELPEGRYVLWIGGGPELSRYESVKLPGRYRPTSLEDAWSRLAAARSSNGLYAALFARAPEVTSEGRDYPELPVSALAVLSPAQASGDQARRGDAARFGETRLPLDGVVRGELLLPVTVDDQAP